MMVAKTDLQTNKPLSLDNLINICPRWPMDAGELIATPLSRRRKRNDNNCDQDLTLADITRAPGMVNYLYSFTYLHLFIIPDMCPVM